MEALVLVVIVTLIGFWSWRTSLLIAVSIPITLAITFGVINTLGMDLPGLDRFADYRARVTGETCRWCRGDAIVHEVRNRQAQARCGMAQTARAERRRWLPRRSVTNIVSYLPFILWPRRVREFLYSLPVVISVSLLAALLVSMTFVPLISSFSLLQGKIESPIEERRKSGFTGWYFRTAQKAIHHRKLFLAASLVVLVAGGVVFSTLKPQFFPKDLQYFSYMDVWLPEDAPASATRAVAERAETIVRHVAEEYGKSHPEHRHPKDVLASMSTFVGGGGPRFWSSATPEGQTDKLRADHSTNQGRSQYIPLLALLQPEFDKQIPGAIIDTRTLETGKPVGIPIQVRISGEDPHGLRVEADKLKQIFGDLHCGQVRDGGRPDCKEVVRVAASTTQTRTASSQIRMFRPQSMQLFTELRPAC